MGNINPLTTHILIITDSELKPLIEAKHKNLKYWIIDCADVWDAYCARTKIMNYSEIDNYDKILYLDIDILFVNPIKPIFDLEIEDTVIYAKEEGVFDNLHAHNFLENTGLDKNRPAFSSAVLLFKNSSEMRRMWDIIINHMTEFKKNPNYMDCFFDQPFICANFYMHGNFDNKLIDKFTINAAYGCEWKWINDPVITPELVIMHCPVASGFKIEVMTKFWNLINPPIVEDILKSGHTLVSAERLENLRTQCIKFKKSNFSFIECGVGRGGCLALMAFYAGLNNKIYGFDSFEGMPAITNEDLGDYNKTSPTQGFGSVGYNISGGIDTVRTLFKNLKIPMQNVKLIKGFFEDSIKADIINEVGNIAILRLDGDWYNSTMVCLERLYDKVVDGGVIIIDDYGHFIGAKRATDEFRERRGITSPLIQTDYTEYYWIKEIKSTNIHEDIWTCSDEMRKDIAEQFTGKNYKISEIGAHKGYSTGHLADIFSHVYALDNSDLWTDFSRQLNRNKSNISYIKLDLYADSWADLPDCDVSFVDAVHSYEHCLMDINNSIANFKSLKYIIFDDYGVWDGVKKAVDECVAAGRFEIVKYIGLTDVPGPQGIVKNTHEGVIVRLPTAS
jgi:hypothetical protein